MTEKKSLPIVMPIGERPESLVTVEDVHCGECGRTETHQDASTWHHRCPGPRDVGQAGRDYQRQRASICEACPHGEREWNGELKQWTCQAVKRQYPKRDAIIAEGIKRPWAYCPHGEWSGVGIRCPECQRYLHDGYRTPVHCHYCGWPLTLEDRTFQSEYIGDRLVAVTSLSLVPHHIGRQKVCLASWKRMGLPIVVVTTSTELPTLAKLYPIVDQWIISEETIEGIQKVKTLCNVAITLAMPILLINSDIEIYGPQSILRDAVREKKQLIGVRWNYQPGDYSTIERERWGLDAFLITPEYAESLPDLPLTLGRPIWDYWIPKHSLLNDVPIWIPDEPLFFHESHGVFWNQEHWDANERIVAEHYGEGFPDGGVPFRMALR